MSTRDRRRLFSQKRQLDLTGDTAVPSPKRFELSHLLVES